MIKKETLLTIFIALLSLTIVSFAQTGTFTGTVCDAEGLPVAEVFEVGDSIRGRMHAGNRGTEIFDEGTEEGERRQGDIVRIGTCGRGRTGDGGDCAGIAGGQEEGGRDRFRLRIHGHLGGFGGGGGVRSAGVYVV